MQYTNVFRLCISSLYTDLSQVILCRWSKDLAWYYVTPGGPLYATLISLRQRVQRYVTPGGPLYATLISLRQRCQLYDAIQDYGTLLCHTIMSNIHITPQMSPHSHTPYGPIWPHCYIR